MSSSLPNTFFGAYSADAGLQRDATLAQNAYTRFLTQQRGARTLAKLDIDGTRGIEGLSSSYGRRGLGNSGIFKNAQNDYASGWMDQRQTALNSIYDELRGATMGDAGAWAQFANNQQSTAMDKFQQILQTAAQLNQLRPFLGG